MGGHPGRASSLSAAGGRYSECEKVQRSKSSISGTANGLAGAADKSDINQNLIIFLNADMAELADAHDSGYATSVIK